MNKYKAKKATYKYKGELITFDSKKEYQYFLRYITEKTFEGKGIITLDTQPRFLLQEAFKDKNGNKHRKIEYIADFRLILEDDTEIIIDVKSSITAKNPVYAMKKKMLLYKYPDINFYEII